MYIYFCYNHSFMLLIEIHNILYETLYDDF